MPRNRPSLSASPPEGNRTTRPLPGARKVGAHRGNWVGFCRAHLRRPVLDTGLVYVERHDTMEGAIAREKLVKKWRREWKFALIQADNPDGTIFGNSGSHPRLPGSSQPPCQARGDGMVMAASGSQATVRSNRPHPPLRLASAAAMAAASQVTRVWV